MNHVHLRKTTAVRLRLMRAIFDNEKNRKTVFRKKQMDALALESVKTPEEINLFLRLLTTLSRPCAMSKGKTTQRQFTLLKDLARHEGIKEVLLTLSPILVQKDIRHELLWTLVNFSIDVNGAEFVCNHILPQLLSLKDPINPTICQRLLMVASNICYHKLDLRLEILYLLRIILDMSARKNMDPISSRCFVNVARCIHSHKYEIRGK
ncbi:hypothetical protein AAMO2058_001281700 [Amorphochlora amoebiformis]